MLNSALQEMTLSSFKIDGRGNQTTVVLRLSCKKTTVRSPVTPFQSASSKKKCQGQVDRDRRRAEAYRAKRQEVNQQAPSPSGLFLPTPPSVLYAADYSDSNDMFTFDSHCPPYTSNCQGEQRIDMTYDNADKQTVAVFCEETDIDQFGGEVVNGMNEYDCEGITEMKYNVSDDKCDVKEYGGGVADECLDNETVADSAERTENVNDSTVTIKDIK
ncbi:hypothetical protein ACOMHN_065348 [Nucella lapillus]